VPRTRPKRDATAPPAAETEPKQRTRVARTAPAAALRPERPRRAVAPRRKPAVSAPDEAAEPAAEATAAAERDETFALPATYGKTRVRLLMQSPGRLFVHWDLSPAVLEELKAQLGHRMAALARMAIRITVPGGGRPLMVLLPKGARSWYVDVPPHRLEYRAEIGLLLPSGEFRPAGVSNPVRMPRTTPSPSTADRRVPFDRTRAPESSALGDIPVDDPTEEELEAFARAELDVDDVLDPGAASAPPGGSSELSAAEQRRRARRGAGGDRGGASDLGPAGSSSDLTRRR
jgi:hypothetical protein